MAQYFKLVEFDLLQFPATILKIEIITTMFSGYKRVLVTFALCAVAIVLYVGVYHPHVLNATVEAVSRKLSLEFDMTTHESLRTVDGVIPEVSCPKGYVITAHCCS